MCLPSPPRRAIASLLLALPLLCAAQGKLLLTGGVSTIEGAAGGGLTPWAVTGSYASAGEVGGSAYLTRVSSQDYSLNSFGVLVSLHDRAEFSLARQDFNTGPAGTALGLPGLHLKQTMAGAKLRVAGDAVLDSDQLMPQLALGLQAKRLDAGGLEATLKSLGAKTHGLDLYVSATKLLLAQSTLVNLTLRASKANQTGLLGFGGAASASLSLCPEVSVAYLISRHLALGAEYRVKPDKLNPSALGAALKEDDWWDVFVAWAPNKQVSITAAYVDLGSIVPGIVPRRQTGAYLSAQLAF